MEHFNPEEYQRYSRHLNLPNFGIDEQLRLKQAKVLIVGAGGLGSPLLLYLTAAGVGRIGIIDNDRVDLSNLQRQILYNQNDIGKNKIEQAVRRARNLNPSIEIIPYINFLTTENALDIIAQYDIVADGTDNFATRYLVNDACVLLDKINVYASIYQFEGQVSVFNYPSTSGTRGPHYRDLFPEPPPPGLVPDCATGGVLGVLAGIVGSMQALEVIKCICGIGQPLSGRLFLYDALSCESRIIKFQNKSNVEITELINYDEFCGVNDSNNSNEENMKEITVAELKKWRDEGKDFQLVDIREQHEIDFVNIGGEHIPMGEVMAQKEKISEEKDVVFMCRSGQRSGAIVNALSTMGYDNLINLKGGINAWAKEIDTSLPTY